MQLVQELQTCTIRNLLRFYGNFNKNICETSRSRRGSVPSLQQSRIRFFRTIFFFECLRVNDSLERTYAGYCDEWPPDRNRVNGRWAPAELIPFTFRSNWYTISMEKLLLCHIFGFVLEFYICTQFYRAMAFCANCLSDELSSVEIFVIQYNSSSRKSGYLCHWTYIIDVNHWWYIICNSKTERWCLIIDCVILLWFFPTSVIRKWPT